MEQQNVTYFAQEMDHGQNGNSQDQYSGQVEFHPNSSSQLSSERNYQGNYGRRTYVRNIIK